MQHETTIQHTSAQFSVRSFLRIALIAASCGIVAWLFLWASGLAQAADAPPKTTKVALTSTPFESFNWRSQPNHFPSAVFNTITVNSTEDSDVAGDTKCTLREAINNANAGSDMTGRDCAAGTAGLDQIHFALGSGTPVINVVQGSLPTILGPVTLDGATGGATRVELNGAGAGELSRGLSLNPTATESTVRSLVLNRFDIGLETYATNGVIENCYVGTDAAGAAASGNGIGVYLIGNGNLLGGNTNSKRNVIAGNQGVNVYLAESANNRVQGNYIGVAADGTTALGGNYGVLVLGAANNLIGGSAAGEGNLIGGNGYGVDIQGAGATGNRVLGNLIGLNAASLTVGNTVTGINLLSDGNFVGGYAPGEGNIIAFNQRGVKVSGLRNAVLGNAIYGNTSLGLDLGSLGVTANDSGDPDSGANNLQNFPVLALVTTPGTVTGSLDSLPANTTYPVRLEFFANAACDSSGHGEGEVYLGFLSLGAPGDFTFNYTPVAGKAVITATATDSNGNTSEFSRCVAPCPVITVNPLAAAQGWVGVPYSQTFTQTGGVAPVTFSWSTVTPPALNPGLSFTSATATLSGTPTLAYTGSLTVTATDWYGCSGSRHYSIVTSNCPTLTVGAPTLPSGTQNQPYSQMISASGGAGPYTFSVSSGTLPTGLVLNSTTGALTGTPAITGTFNFTVRATDANGCSGMQAYTVTIAAGCPAINLTNAPLPFAVVNSFYNNTTFAAFGGTAPYNFIATGLPPGLSLTGSFANFRILSGNPTAPGGYSFTITATDANGCTGSQTYHFVVHSDSATLLVTTAVDEFDTNPAACSLREAIIAANTNSPFGGCGAGQLGYDTIGFAEPYVIALTSGLPSPGEAVFINGLVNQTRVELNGASASASQIILLESAYHYVKSLVINRLISGAAINLSGPDAYRNVIQDCYLGTNAAGTSAFPNLNGVGVFDNAKLNRIGGLSSDPNVMPGNRANVISGNIASGITLAFSSANDIIGNLIGVQAGGISPLGNGADGIDVLYASFRLGENTIAHNSTGVLVTQGVGAFLYANSIFNNNLLGIDLGGDGVTPNDALDADNGPNRLQNFPLLNPVTTAGTITGSLDTAAANASYPIRLEFYANSACDPSGYGEAETFLGFISVANATAASNFTFTYNVAQTIGKPFLTAIATDAAGNTSEISACRQAFTCPAVTIAPETLATGLVGNAYSAQLSLSGAGVTASDSLVITGDLPPGITLNQAATRLEGTPTQPGSYPFTATWAFNDTCLTSRTYTLSVTCPNVTIGPETLPNGVAGAPYNTQLFLVGAGVTDSNNLVITGTLPPGITLNGAATRLEGTPTQTGSFTFTATWTFNGTCQVSRTYTLAVNCPAITLAPTTLPAGIVGQTYNQNLSQAGGFGAINYTVNAGTLPTGLGLSAAGSLSGVPTTTGVFTFTVRATDANGCTGERAYTVRICAEVTLGPATLTSATTGTPYSQTLTASGGTGPYSFALLTGSLPTGLTLSSSGLLAGTPLQSGTFNLTLSATDANGCVGTAVRALTVSCQVVTLNPATLPVGLVNRPYPATTIAALGGTGPYSFTLTGSLPPGLSFAGGVLSGVPLQRGSFNLSITATDAAGCMGTKSYTLVVRTTIVRADFDADGQSDFSVWRGATGAWLSLNSSNGGIQSLIWGTGAAPYFDVIVPGDYDGDGQTDQAIWRGGDSLWYIRKSSDGQAIVQLWGANYAPYFDVPVPADYDGDGKTDLAVWRPGTGTWFVSQSSDGSVLSEAWGGQGDVPVPGDYDGDGKTDLAVWRGSTGTWFCKLSSGGTQILAWGAGYAPYHDVPVPADYDGDGKTDLAIWRGQDSIWYIRQSSNGQGRLELWGANYAPYNDVPVPGDFDGDGKADIAVWRPATGTWFVRKSSDGGNLIRVFGQTGDTPVPAADVR